MEGVIKQWFMWVKPNFENVGACCEFDFLQHAQLTCPQYVDPQRKNADVIVPTRVENTVAIGMSG